MASKKNQALEHLYLIDGSGYIFRAYHALPPMQRSDGTPTNAVLGFSNMLFKLIEDLNEGEKPTHLAVIFDRGRRTFRNDIYEDYKAHRPPPPEDLIPQFALIRKATVAFGLPSIEKEGFEADDLIATYARLATDRGWTTTIVSSDKDLMQLVGEQVDMFDSMKNKRLGEAEVIDKFGVGPDKVVEIQALAGDSSDNVPGVPGIGVKTAAQLIAEYGDLDRLLERAGEIKQPKRRENLIENAELARISRELVRLRDDVPIEHSLDEFKITLGLNTTTKFRPDKRELSILKKSPLKNPDIFLTDAIDTGLKTRLDLANNFDMVKDAERKVNVALDNLRGKQTTLIIAHRLATVFSADVILVFDNGVIVEQGNHAELIRKSGVYARLASEQMNLAAGDLQKLFNH